MSLVQWFHAHVVELHNECSPSKTRKSNRSHPNRSVPATCRLNLFAGMARTIENSLKSGHHLRDIPQVAASPDDLHDKTHESEFSEDSEQLSDEDGDSDYETSRKKGKPPAKRAKKSSGVAQAKQSSAKGSRLKKSLSLLPSMPLDVLFEVFSHLTPKDIIHISRTSRVFRDTLMMKNATSVWKAARERLAAPECPSNMSEPQWAVLLFGNLCQSCGAKNISKPEFALLRRVCINCKKHNFLVESRFKTRFPDVDEEVLELIPFTNVGAWSQGYARSSRFFWISDIDIMLHRLAEYQHDIHLRRPGAQKALENFKAQQVELVADIRELKGERERWCEQFSMGRYNDKQTVIDQRFKAIRSKFIEMGYTSSDVAYVRSQRECQQPALLTDRIWNRICPILEPMVLERKKERLETEMRQIRSARREIIYTSYKEYQKMLMPSQWKYLPRTVDICAMDPFAAVVDAEGDVVVTAANFEDSFHRLPELISADSDARKLHARSLLKIATAVNQPTSSGPELGELVEGEASSSLSSLQSDPLDLATAAFTCQEKSCNSYGGESYLFGWDDIAQHHCKSDLNSISRNMHWIYHRVECEPGPPKIDFSTQGSEFAAAVVRAAGLDDKVATALDMDAKAKDIRFGCSVCPPQKRNKSWMKVGYKWREFVLHCTARLHPKDVLVVLPPDVVAKVKETEMTNPHLLKSQWTCGHCSAHLGDLKRREIVVEHLKSVHGIESPCEPEDLFFFTRNPSFVTFEAGYPVDSPPAGSATIVKTIRCMECATGKLSEQQRLFDVGGVRSHLSAKHKVKSPVAGIHYG